MRILHISTRMIIGGSQEAVVLSCVGQADLGHSVGLAHGPVYGPEGSMLPAMEADGRTELFEVPTMRRELAPLADLRAYFATRRLIRRWRPDVVHTHSSKAGIVGRLAAWREKVPRVVHTVHGFAFDEFQSPWRNRLYIWSERLAAKRCHAIAFVSEGLRDQARAARVGSDDQYSVIHTGMNVGPYLESDEVRDEARAELGIEPDEIVFGTVARLVELKGHDDVLDAMVGPMKEDPRLKLLWVGDGWWRERLEERIRDAGLESRVVRTGLVDPREIPRLVAAMDVMIQPSYREGLPRSLVQSLLAARPILAYDVGGVSEILEEGETGRLVAAGDVDALRDAALWLRDHREERIRMGARGRERTLETFPTERMIEAFEAVYTGE